MNEGKTLPKRGPLDACATCIHWNKPGAFKTTNGDFASLCYLNQPRYSSITLASGWCYEFKPSPGRTIEHLITVLRQLADQLERGDK